MKVQRPDSVESLRTHPSVLELNSLCSRPSLVPRAEPGKGPLPASPKGKKKSPGK